MEFDKRQKLAQKLAIRHYFEQFWLDKKFSLPSIAFAAVGNILIFYVPPLIIGKFLQRYSSQPIPELSSIAPYLLAFAGFWMLGEILWRAAWHVLIRSQINASGRLYNNAVKLLLKKDLAFFHENFAGSLTKKTLAYGRNYVIISDTFVLNIASQLLPLTFVCYVLWLFSPFLAIGLILWTIAVVVFISPLIRRRSKMVAIRETAANKLSGYVADIYTNVDAVRTYGREDFELSVHRINTADFMQKTKTSWDYSNQRIDVTISPIYVLTNVFGLIFAIFLARQTGANIETVFVTFSYYSLFTRVMWEFNDIYRRMETGFSEAAQFTELLLDKSVVNDPDKPISFKVNEGRLEFKNVDFKYQESQNNKLFENLNLSIKSGEKVGLVGHSGGGKTTLTKLIMRLMNLNRGEILIDGQNIALARQSDLRGALSYVPQDPGMFHRSLAENIAYGKQNASQSEIVKAAKMAHAHEFIQNLPDGYGTLVGERGVKLSGGQRQRIAIARAILKDAPILLLDEATSALDSESEKLIQDALWKLMRGKTAIVIAHRLSTIQKMDRIIVLEDGKIIEEGNHKQLLAKRGVYAELWKHQSGGFLDS